MLSLKKTEMAELETKISDLAEIFSQQTRELQLATDAKEQDLQSREIAISRGPTAIPEVREDAKTQDACCKQHSQPSTSLTAE